jgi:hypothetical protein
VKSVSAEASGVEVASFRALSVGFGPGEPSSCTGNAVGFWEATVIPGNIPPVSSSTSLPASRAASTRSYARETDVSGSIGEGFGYLAHCRGVDIEPSEQALPGDARHG